MDGQDWTPVIVGKKSYASALGSSGSRVVPAPAQGVLGLQIREDDTRMAEIMQHLNHRDVAKRIGIERKVLNLLDGGCQLPLGVYCPNEKQVFVSHATSSNVAAKGYYYEPENLDEVVTQIVSDLKNASVES